MAAPRWVWDNTLTNEQKSAMIQEEIRIEKIMYKSLGWIAFTALLIMIAMGVI